MLAGALGQLGPQVAAPEEVVTVPVFTVIGGIGGSIGGYFAGSQAGKNYYDFIQQELKRWRR
jgi:hypothetical protein